MVPWARGRTARPSSRQLATKPARTRRSAIHSTGYRPALHRRPRQRNHHEDNGHRAMRLLERAASNITTWYMVCISLLRTSHGWLSHKLCIPIILNKHYLGPVCTPPSGAAPTPLGTNTTTASIMQLIVTYMYSGRSSMNMNRICTCIMNTFNSIIVIIYILNWTIAMPIAAVRRG